MIILRKATYTLFWNHEDRMSSSSFHSSKHSDRGYDNCAFWISARGILGHIWGTSGFADFFFVQNFPPALQKPFLQIQRFPPLGVEKKFLHINFLSKPCDGIWSHDSKMVEHLGIENIFCKYLVKNIFENIFSNFLKKYLK